MITLVVCRCTALWEVVVSAFENELGVQDPVGFWDPAGSLGQHLCAERVIL